jgi:hypothetical protein
MRYRARACRSRFIDASHRSVAITESNSARRLRGPHLGLPIGKATLAGFLTGKAEMRGMCGAQHLIIEDIVNILITYPNYGFWQRAADRLKPVRPPRAPVPTPWAPGPLKTRLQVLSMCFRTAALTPSMLRASMTRKSTTWSVCTARKCSSGRVSVSPHARLIANASASHRARMKNGVSVSCS